MGDSWLEHERRVEPKEGMVAAVNQTRIEPWTRWERCQCLPMRCGVYRPNAARRKNFPISSLRPLPAFVDGPSSQIKKSRRPSRIGKPAVSDPKLADAIGERPPMRCLPGGHREHFRRRSLPRPGPALSHTT